MFNVTFGLLWLYSNGYRVVMGDMGWSYFLTTDSLFIPSAPFGRLPRYSTGCAKTTNEVLVSIHIGTKTGSVIVTIRLQDAGHSRLFAK